MTLHQLSLSTVLFSRPLRGQSQGRRNKREQSMALYRGLESFNTVCWVLIQALIFLFKIVSIRAYCNFFILKSIPNEKVLCEKQNTHTINQTSLVMISTNYSTFETTIIMMILLQYLSRCFCGEEQEMDGHEYVSPPSRAG